MRMLRHQSRYRNRRPGSRRGTVIVATMVCLLVVSGVLGSMLLCSLQARSQLRLERDLRQTELLLRAGLERSKLQLKNNPAYQGEEWRLSPSEISGGGAGLVTIQATRDEAANAWQVSVVAEYPLGGERSIRRSQSVSIPISTTQAKE